jgi:hypothetical protein
VYVEDDEIIDNTERPMSPLLGAPRDAERNEPARGRALRRAASCKLDAPSAGTNDKHGAAL